MAIDLTLRSENGAALTAVQNDTNLSDIQTAVNGLETSVTAIQADFLSTTDFDAFFEGEASGKKQVSWDRITDKPEQLALPVLFRAVKTDADQTISASGTVTVNFPTETYDIGSDFAASTFTAPAAGVYSLSTSVQVELVSGSPSNVSIVVTLAVNGSPQDQVTLDNTGTGTRIYKLPSQLQLAAADEVVVLTDFTFSGTATWKVSANNTSFWGKLEHEL